MSDTFSLKYNFRNKWSSSDLLKYKVFLSGFDLGSDANVIKIYLEKTDITESGLVLRFTTKGTQTKINGLNVDIIVFNAYNPAFRYAEGVVSQNFLKTKLSIEIPPQGVSELRTYMIGLSSFEVNTDTPISLYSSMNRVFSLEIGPVSDVCQINHLTISYLILSVYPGCGPCGKYVIDNNGKCV